MKKHATTYILAAACLALSSCQTLQNFANLAQVDFDIDRVSSMELANVRIDRARSGGLGAADLARVGAAVMQGRVPLEFTLHLGADNPASNDVDARLVELDWTLFLEDRETVSGTLTDDIIIAAGRRTDIPIPIRLDLVQFFGNNLNDLVELALNVSGNGGEPKNIRIQATPIIETPLGRIRYPRPLDIVSRDVGAQ